MSATSRPTRSSNSHVAIATLNRLSGVTGVHTHTRVLTGGLAEAGIASTVISPFSGSRAWLPLFAVRPLVLKRLMPTQGTLWYRYWHATALRANLVAALRSGPITQVIAQCPPSAQVALEVRESLGLAQQLPVTMVCHFNGSEADEYRDQGALRGAAYYRVKAAEERTLRAVDRVIYVSSWAREIVEQQRGVVPRESAVVWNGIEARPTVASPTDRSTIGLNPDHLVLINVGTLEPRKDQLGLLHLFARLHDNFPHARLLLVGDGPQRAAIEAESVSLGISDAVTLLGHRDDVPGLLQTADLYVHYAAAENCPMVLLEASRAGLPWAGRPSGGVGELARALHGTALSPDSIEQSVDILRPLLADKSLRQSVGQQTRECFLSGFTRQAMTDAYIRALGLNLTPRVAA
jgi:glycosyltransferase involved in cell wall biosynthesis